MFTFNRNEQIAIIVLTALLIVGSIVSAYDYFWPSEIETFRVHKAAIPVPPESDHSATEVEEPTGPIDVNTATASSLTTLPQVGPKTAERIIAYRDSNGPFSSVEELTKVRGIGPKTIEKLRPLVMVDNP